MFDFEKKDLERLYTAYVKNDPEDFPISSRYLYIDNGRMIFISKNRKEYRLYSSGNTGLKPFRTTSVFDILFINEDLQKVIQAFKYAVFNLWSEKK